MVKHRIWWRNKNVESIEVHFTHLIWSSGNVVSISSITITFLFFYFSAFFTYKLIKSLREKERLKEEKKKLKQQRKERDNNKKTKKKNWWKGSLDTSFHHELLCKIIIIVFIKWMRKKVKDDGYWSKPPGQQIRSKIDCFQKA